MKRYSLFDKPLKVFGVPFFEQNKKLTRLTDEVIEKLPHLDHLGRRCSGGIVAFKTDSDTFTIKVLLKTLTVDVGMSLFSCQSAQVMVGERAKARYYGVVYPSDYSELTYERTFHKSPVLEQISIYFPRNEQLENIEVFINDDAIITEPTPYKYEKPVLFYGSSITEGGCACNTTNMYPAILSRWLDFETYNFGFSGNAKGELEMADYINTIDMGVFVFDYDHNAPDIEHLRKTHKPFFERIRQKHPDIPIVMMTRPAEFYYDEFKERREIVKATYEWAISNGDENVYFIDGETFYGLKDRNLCSIDDCHPNDLGFFRMATVIEPILKQALESTKG